MSDPADRERPIPTRGRGPRKFIAVVVGLVSICTLAVAILWLRATRLPPTEREAQEEPGRDHGP
ncbi:hypothetical protein [Enhygromyxa salina]|uniref:hypothetical protein n=1 Tax=Enhygromyxa salina TaxID=215803 RepID=UPI0011B21122|nr:hypothetical protein [Enhygromyxa salina]